MAASLSRDEEAAALVKVEEISGQPRLRRTFFRVAPAMGLAAAAALLFVIALAVAPSSTGAYKADADATQMLQGGACADDLGPCKDSKCCNNPESACFQKNDYWATCMPTCEPGVHKDEPKKFWSPWTCKELSQPRATTTKPAGEAAAPAARPAVAGPSLFCFATLSPGPGTAASEELSLAKAQLTKGTGIFGCNAWTVFSQDVPISLATEPKSIMTTVLPKTLTVGSGFEWKAHLAAWESICIDGDFEDHAVVVKADLKTAFMPDRLRQKMNQGELPIESRVAYVRTSQSAFGGNGGMSQPLEVISTNALKVYAHGRLRNAARCLVELPYQDLGEELFMQECLDLHRVDHVEAFGLLSAHKDSCAVPGPVAFYPFHRPSAFDACVGQASQ